jgi:choline dehydrogenase
MRGEFFVKYHANETSNGQYDHLTWRMPDGEFYLGMSPLAGAKQLGV